MSRSLNKAILIGNLGADPEVRTTAGGTRVAGFSLATSRSWTDREGQPQERTEWHRIVAWDKLADIAEQFLHKGDRVYVEGEIQSRSYEDKEGVTRYVTEIRVRELVMLGGREAPQAEPAQDRKADGKGSRGSREPARAARRGSGYDDFQAPPYDGDDDLPF
jgi:single-strand DNA-binding protein